MKVRRYTGLMAITTLLCFGGCIEESPFPEADPWEYAYPTNTSLSPSVLSEMHAAIEQGSFGDIHSVVIVREHKIAYEHYYNGHQRDDLQALDAVTKSVVSALLGAVIRKDTSISVNDLLINVLPQYGHLFDNVPQKDAIRVRDILSNSSGFWWEEWDMPYSDPSNDANAMTVSEDWTEWVLSKPMIREPGFEFEYNSGNAVLLGSVLEHYTGTPVEETARQLLFEPLGINAWQWDTTRDGSHDVAWGLRLRPVDLARIGYLFVQGGAWEGSRVFGEEWVRQSTRYRESISNYFHYGYQWWRFAGNTDVVRILESKGMTRNDIFFAWGRGDQLLFVLPSFDMVAVITAGNAPTYRVEIFALLLDYIIPSISPLPFSYP